MGNVEMCASSPVQEMSGDLELYGHINNSQTRAILGILDASKIPYKFVKIDTPKQKANNPM